MSRSLLLMLRLGIALHYQRALRKIQENRSEDPPEEIARVALNQAFQMKYGKLRVIEPSDDEEKER